MKKYYHLCTNKSERSWGFFDSEQEALGYLRDLRSNGHAITEWRITYDGQPVSQSRREP